MRWIAGRPESVRRMSRMMHVATGADGDDMSSQCLCSCRMGFYLRCGTRTYLFVRVALGRPFIPAPATVGVVVALLSGGGCIRYPSHYPPPPLDPSIHCIRRPV